MFIIIARNILLSSSCIQIIRFLLQTRFRETRRSHRFQYRDRLKGKKEPSRLAEPFTWFRSSWSLYPSTAPALNRHYICDPIGFDAEIWHSLELHMTASVFQFLVSPHKYFVEYKPEVIAFPYSRIFFHKSKFRVFGFFKLEQCVLLCYFLQHVPMYVFREVAAKCQIF